MQIRNLRWVRHLAAVVALSALFNAQATERYVAQTGQTPDPVAGYTSWSGAASNLQDVINLAATVAGDIIYITNGTYKLSDEIVVSKPVIIRSYNALGQTDPENTILDGNNYAGKPVTNRVLKITSNATIDGLTLTGGKRPNVNLTDADGGGIWITTTTTAALVTNCTITGNYAHHGGGISTLNSPVSITHCRIVTNEAAAWGGGAYLNSTANYTAEIRDSVIGWNKSTSDGSGVAISSGKPPHVYNCDIVSNEQSSAVCFISAGVISNCVIRGTRNSPNGAVIPRVNSAVKNYVLNCQIVDNYCGGAVIARGVTYRNCLIARNQGVLFGGFNANYEDGGTVESCTVAGNSGSQPLINGGSVGGVSMTGTNAIFRNTIFSGNTGTKFNDVWFSSPLAVSEGTNCFFNSCCPTVALLEAQGNVHADPRFVDAIAGNFRLRGSSPCINTGVNQDWMSKWLGFDAKPRLDKLSGVVDMGCFEYISLGSLLQIR